MNIEALKEMAAMGLTIDQAIKLFESMDKRSSGAERQARYRRRHNGSDVTRNVTGDAPLSPETKGPPDPLKNPSPIQAPSPPVVPRSLAKPTAGEVETIWMLQPMPHGKRRSTRPDVERALGAALRRGGQFEEIAGACRAYYALDDSQREAGQFAMGAARLLEADRWRDYLGAQTNGKTRVSHWGRDEWGLALRDFADSQRWPDAFGPLPGEPGCLVPPHILAELAPPEVGANVIPFERCAAA